MRYIFYADVYFIQNFVMKVAVLYLALKYSKNDEVIAHIKGIVKIVIATGLATIFEICGLLFVNNYTLFLLLVNVFEIPCMLIFILGKEKKYILRLILLGYFFMMSINSVLEVLWNLLGERGSYLFYLLFSCGAVAVGVRMWKNYAKMRKGIFSAELVYRGKKIQLHAFYDSGNRLTDPYTGKGVHIVSRQLIERLRDMENKPVYVPYQALGNEAGLLEVYYMDELMIEGEKGRSIVNNCPVGVTKDNLFEGKNYEMILNEEVF